MTCAKKNYFHHNHSEKEIVKVIKALKNLLRQMTVLKIIYIKKM